MDQRPIVRLQSLSAFLAVVLLASLPRPHQCVLPRVAPSAALVPLLLPVPRNLRNQGQISPARPALLPCP